VEAAKKTLCQRCKGSGLAHYVVRNGYFEDEELCPDCEGWGWFPKGPTQDTSSSCPACLGTRRHAHFPRRPCSVCGDSPSSIFDDISSILAQIPTERFEIMMKWHRDQAAAWYRAFPSIEQGHMQAHRVAALLIRLYLETRQT